VALTVADRPLDELDQVVEALVDRVVSHPVPRRKLSGEFRPGGRRPEREELLSPASPKDEVERFGSALWWRLLSGGAESPGTGRRWALRAARSGWIMQTRGLMLVTKHRRDSGSRDPDQNGARSMSYVAACGGQSSAMRRSRRHADRLYSDSETGSPGAPGRPALRVQRERGWMSGRWAEPFAGTARSVLVAAVQRLRFTEDSVA
jgi:hypothetical protein